VLRVACCVLRAACCVLRAAHYVAWWVVWLWGWDCGVEDNLHIQNHKCNVALLDRDFCVSIVLIDIYILIKSYVFILSFFLISRVPIRSVLFVKTELQYLFTSFYLQLPLGTLECCMRHQ
jgi:hypothetical protein